jgi:hypothetical protein
MILDEKCVKVIQAFKNSNNRWNKNTFFHKNNTLTIEIQQLALSNWLSYWPIIFNQDMNIPKFNSMSFLACSLRAMTVL